MAALDEFFFKIQEIEAGDAVVNLNAAGEMGIQNDENSPHNHSPRAGECDFAMMDKRGHQWSKWTGNLPVSAELQKMIVPAFHSAHFSGEVLKVPFKSSAWLRNGKNKLALSDSSGRRLPTTETIESLTGTHISQLSDSFSEVALQHNEAHAAMHVAQSAYGKVRYEPKPFCQHWHDLTLTECLMTSPFFQQLSSEKFSALEHFAVLRSFKDGDTVLSKEQKFYDVFFIRYPFSLFLSHLSFNLFHAKNNADMVPLLLANPRRTILPRL